MKSILAIIAFLIVYGSLYPFNFELTPFSSDALAALFNFNILKTGLTDLIANIVLFIPMGLVIQGLINKRTQQNTSPNSEATSLPILFFSAIAVFVFAYGIQGLQLFTTDRLPWGGDAVWNMVGYGLGLLLYSTIKFEFLQSLKQVDNAKQLCITLAAAIFVLELAPFAPSIDFEVLKQNIKLLIQNPTIDWYWTFENTVFLLTAFYLTKLAQPRWATMSKLAILMVLLLCAKFIIIANNINLSSLVAGFVALVVWSMLHRSIGPRVLSLLLLVSIVANGLYPFEFASTNKAFNWLPFSGSMNGNILLNIVVFAKKMTLYGAAIWLFYLHNKKLLSATLICASVILLAELMQIRVPSSVPESTDIVLALFVGFIINKWLKAQPVSISTASSGGFQSGSTIETRLNKPILATALKRRDHNYIAGLDGLRGIAAFAVFMVHFQQFSGIGGNIGFIDLERWMVNGNTGVGLFFILSGFLLAMPFWRGFENDTRPNLKSYFINRAARIIPLYYLCLFSLLLLKGGSGGEANFNNIISHMLFLHNLKDYQVMSLNPPFWTLAVEFQFYILLPFIFLGLMKFRRSIAAIVLLVLIPTIYFAYRFFMQSMESHTQWPISFPLIWPIGIDIGSAKGMSLTYSLFAHLPHFLIGVFVANFFTTQKRALAEVTFWASTLIAFAILATTLDDVFQLDFGRYNFPFVPILLALIVFSAPKTKLASAFLESWPLRTLGLVSYGVYIFHYPIQKASLKLIELGGGTVAEQVTLFFFMSLLLTLITATLMYRIIELPAIRYFKQRKQSTDSADSESIDEKTTFKTAELRVESTPKARDENVRRAGLMTQKKGLPIFIGLCAVFIIAGGFYYFSSSTPKNRVEQPFWAGSTLDPVIFDHHTHTTFSDGSKSVSEITELAYLGGCDAFAITDHSGLVGANNYSTFDEIRQARKDYPVLMIFAGLEIGMPSYFQREHVNLITTPDYEDAVINTALSALADVKKFEKPDWDNSVFDAIHAVPRASRHTIGIYNHPSRKDLNKDKDENYSDISIWNKTRLNVTALSGAPGHQKKKMIGSYEVKIRPIDRWDPAVAEVGGTWDRLLSEGMPIWGAIASSDYHNDKMDYPPCAFSRIHVKTPTRDYAGVMQGLKEGTFWADHGKLLNDYRFSITSGDQKAMAFPGGTLNLFGDNDVIFVDLEISPTSEYQQEYFYTEVITNCAREEVGTEGKLLAPGETKMRLMIPIDGANKTGEQCFLRSRVINESGEDNRLSAYSNPIFIKY